MRPSVLPRGGLSSGCSGPCELGLRGWQMALRGCGRGPQLSRPHVTLVLWRTSLFWALSCHLERVTWATRCPVPADSSPQRPSSSEGPVGTHRGAPGTFPGVHCRWQDPVCSAKCVRATCSPQHSTARHGLGPSHLRPGVPSAGPLNVVWVLVSFSATCTQGRSWHASAHRGWPSRFLSHQHTWRSGVATGVRGTCSHPSRRVGSGSGWGHWLRVGVAAQWRPWEPKEAGWPWGGGHRGRGACRF